jgi:hypothetical protein
MMTDIKRLIAELDRYISKEERDLVKWMGTLTSHPRYAFEWGDAAFQTAANLEIANHVRIWAAKAEEDGINLLEDAVRDEMAKEFMRRASKIGGSTNASHNLMEKFYVEALARFLDPDAWGSQLSLKSLFRSAS